MPEIKKTGNDLELTLLTKNRARFGFYAPAGYIVINADWFEWNRKGDHRFNGYVTSDRKITFRQFNRTGLVFLNSDFLISQITENESEIILSLLHNKEQKNKLIRFSSIEEVQSIHLNNQLIVPVISGNQYVLKLDLVMGENTLRISF